MELPVLQNYFFNDAPFWPPNLSSLAAYYDPSYGVYQDGARHFTKASRQYISRSSSGLPTGDFSLHTWVKADTVAQYDAILGTTSSGSWNNGFGLFWGTTNRITGFCNDYSSGGITSGVLTVTNWNHIVLTRSGTTLTLYVNGTSAGTLTVSGAISHGSNLYLGFMQSAYYLDGTLDSAAIASRAFSAAEVTQLYNSGNGRVYADLAGLGFDTTGLVSWWDLSEEVGTAYDAHGTNNLTASNTTLIAPPTFGSELITNGTFDSATTGWTATNSTLSSVAGGESGNCLQVTNVGANYGYAYVSLTTVVGATYQIRVAHKSGTTSGSVAVSAIGAGGGDITSAAYDDGTWIVYSLRFTATTTTTYVSLINGTNTDTLTTLWDGVSVKKVTAETLNGGFEQETVGSEIITGDSANFTGGTVGNWTAAGSSVVASVVSGQLQVAYTASAGGVYLNNLSFRPAAGKRYRLTFQAQLSSGASTPLTIRGSGTATGIVASSTVTPDGTLRTYTIDLCCNAAEFLYIVYDSAITSTFLFDNFSLKEISFTSWTGSFSGSSSIFKETSVVKTGAYACKLTADGSNSLVSVALNPGPMRAGDRYSYSFWSRSASGAPTLSVNDGLSVQLSFTLSTTYTQFTGSFVCTNNALEFKRGSMTSNSAYIDDVTVTDLGPVGVAGIAAGIATDGNFCGQFAGSASQSLTTSTRVLDPAQPHSVTAWVCPDAMVSGKLYTVWDQSLLTNSLRQLIYIEGSTGRGYYTVDAFSTIDGTPIAGPFFAPGKWSMITAVFDGSKTTMYIDTSAGVQGAARTPNTTATYTCIGGEGTGSLSYPMLGRIDGVKQYQKALTAQEITTLYNGGKGLKTAQLTGSLLTSLVASHDLDKKAGITVDSIGSNTLTNNGSVTYGQGVDYYTGTISKWLDQSSSARHLTQATQGLRPVFVSNVQNGKPMALFQGANYISGSSAALGTTHTAFIVVNPTALSGVLFGGSANNSPFTLGATNVTYNAQGTSVAVAHGMSTGTCYILSVIRNGTTVQFFKNGVQIGTDQTLGANNTLTVTTAGAYSDGTSPCSAYLGDDVICTTALSATEHAKVITFLKLKYGL